MATNGSTEARPPAKPHWTEGPARWAASIVLGAACLGGLGWSIFGRPVAVGPGGLPARAVTDRSPAAESRDAAAIEAGRGTAEVIDVVEDESYAQRIDVNTAGSAELQLLPGIGPALAERIMQDREANGPFSSVDDLMRVKGIGPRTVARLRDMARAE
jgi:comEA protein